MSGWQPIDTAPKDGTKIWVAFHGHGKSQVQIVSWASGSWDYINSHDGQPQWWMPLLTPEPPPGLAGPHCECDGCVERYENTNYPEVAMTERFVEIACSEFGNVEASIDSPQSIVLFAFEGGDRINLNLDQARSLYEWLSRAIPPNQADSQLT